eukprot:m.128129 g.128129  ORF g.128129 m.128129 type:complete len:1073 (+) comp13865_c0_seq1:107-3325(+)
MAEEVEHAAIGVAHVEEELEAIGDNPITASEALIRFTREGDESAVKRLLTVDCMQYALDRLDDEQHAALHYAARAKALGLAKLLVEAGANPTVSGEEGVTPIHLAAKYGSPDLLTLLLDSAPEDGVNVTDDYQSTPLHFATLRVNMDCVRSLLQRGANIDAVDKQGETPLHIACIHGRTQVVSILLGFNANLMSADDSHNTPLHYAAMGGFTKIIRKLLRAVDDVPALLSVRNTESMVPLHCAVLHNHYRASELLLKNGARCDAQTGEGSTPLHLAVSVGDTRLLELLLMYKAQINAEDFEGMTALHRASMLNEIDAMNMLIERNANINARDSDGFTPLLLACWKGQLQATELLLSHSASLRAFDKQGKSALHWAIEENHTALVAKLIEECSSRHDRRAMRSTDRFANSAIHVAAEVGNINIVKLLLESSEREYFLEAKNDEDRNALHIAARFGHSKVASMLIKAEPTLVDDADHRRYQPLHLAAIHGHPKTVELLLKSGGSVAARNDVRWTALDCAANGGELEVIKVLVKYRAPIDATDNNKRTPLHLASLNGHTEVVEYLLDHRASLDAVDTDGCNALDLAVEAGKLDVALMIVRHKDWEKAMRNDQCPDMTPMKRMILKLPDAALAVLDKCRSTSSKTASHKDFHITYNWRYIDQDFSDDFNPESSPLWLMQQLSRSELLEHETVESLLFYKHKHFGAVIYLLNLFLYCVFVFFFTWIIIANPVNLGQPLAFTGLSTAAQYFVVAFSGIRIVVEALQFCFEGPKKYLPDPVNYLEWAVFSFTLATLIPVWFDQPQTVAQWSCGAISIFLCWINLIVYVRKLDVFGLYVLMFEETMFTVLKVLSIFFLFVVGFALSFYILLPESYYFGTISNSLMKTFVMMTGEFEYSYYFPSLAVANVLPYIMFIIFVIIMPIIIMNLLIGLAVGDIQRILDHARLNRRRLRILDLLPTQAFLVWFKLRLPWLAWLLPGASDWMYYEPVHQMQPNHYSLWRYVSSRILRTQTALGDISTEDYEQSSVMAQLVKENEQLKVEMSRLDQKLRRVMGALDEQSGVIAAICQAHDIPMELDLE